VNIEDKSELTAIDPNKLEVKAKWPLAPCESPSGLSMDKKNRRLFVGCDNKMTAVVDCRLRQSPGHAGHWRLAWTPPPSTTELGWLSHRAGKVC